MNSAKAINELELIQSAAIKAIDEGIKYLDNNKLDWCLRYIERRIVSIREEMEII